MSIPDYPRTLHLGDSGGGRSKHHRPFSELAGKHLVVEEKVDGSHCGLFFDDQAELRLFSRKTVLERPPHRRDFRLLDRLCVEAIDELWEVLGDNFVLYGEWTQVTHSIYYDALPAFFIEDDVFDRQRGCFLSTPRREAFCAALPAAFRHSATVLHRGPVHSIEALHQLVGTSAYKSAQWRERCPALDSVEDSDEMEGLYIKHEDEDAVIGRYKWIRPAFLAHIAKAKQHWRARTEIHNGLATPSGVPPYP